MTKKLVQFPIRSKDEYDFSYIQFLLQSFDTEMKPG